MVSGRISTNTIRAPLCTKASAVETNVYDGMMTSSPGWISLRNAAISNARQIAMYVVREITQLPMASVGAEFGGRDHSTVVYATQQVEKNMTRDPRTKATVEDIIKNIRDR